MSESADRTVRDHFDRNTQFYVDRVALECSVISRERLDMLEPLVKARGGALRILDIGCGAGIFTDLVLERWPLSTAVCLDASEQMLRRNRADPRKSLVLGDASRLPLQPGQFDLINLDAIMHHMIDPAGYTQTLGRIRSLLNVLSSLLRSQGVIGIREIYHESFGVETLGSRVMFDLSTRRLPAPVAGILKRMGLNTVNVGVCFLSRAQWSAVLGDAGLRVVAQADKPWLKSPLRRLGFRANGNIYYVLTPGETNALASS